MYRVSGSKAGDFWCELSVCGILENWRCEKQTEGSECRQTVMVGV